MKSGSLNLLKPSGPVKACNGIALPLPLHKYRYTKRNYNKKEQQQDDKIMLNYRPNG
jgi:hypothetical protein